MSNECLDVHFGGHFLNYGIMRGLGGMGLGYFLAKAYRFYTERIIPRSAMSVRRNFRITLGATLCEVCLIAFLINNTMFHNMKFSNDFIFVIAFIALFWMFLIRRGFISRLLDNNFSVFLGKYSYSIYVMHLTVISTAKFFISVPHPEFAQAHPFLNIIVIIVAAIVLGIITYHLVEKPAANYLAKKWRSKFD
jgi:peptidoglycan/LPS O-acetylase OafA/YrhL